MDEIWEGNLLSLHWDFHNGSSSVALAVIANQEETPY